MSKNWWTVHTITTDWDGSLILAETQVDSEHAARRLGSAYVTYGREVQQ